MSIANNEFSLVRTPWVVLDNVVNGACVRGKLPMIKQCYKGYERMRTLDGSCTLFHTFLGTVVPFGGVGDHMPFYPG